MNSLIQNIIFDVDGVLTDGSFYYSDKGKKYKRFGAHDADGIILLKKYFKVFFISSDLRGYKISSKRIKDMGFKLNYIKSSERYSYLKKKGENQTIFVGDGIYDLKLIKKCKYGISTNNSIDIVKKYSNYVTKNNGGSGAVFEIACHIYKKILKKNYYEDFI
jgi:3-deoxy-D-manno-octulosonate 8-phosphate phosphatase (KDO 8-P phosphatase)|tara:strand:- start:273 stop:758 length:486 start_codon:yes stop_codon:yes gene_type:complete